MAWDKSDYQEALRLAKEGVNHDSGWAGLVSDWHKWEYKIYQKTGDNDNTLQLARYFFFKGGRWGEKEFSVATMYAAMKDLVSNNQWRTYVETLISEAQRAQDSSRLLYIYTEEKIWDKYMDYIRKNPSIYNIDDAPKEIKKLYKDEIIKLYSSGVRNFFQRASSRGSYREGVGLLRNLIKYGGKSEVDQIVIEQKSRMPRRPALIDELSKL